MTRRDDILGPLQPDAYPYVYAGGIAYDFEDPAGPRAIGGVIGSRLWVGPDRVYQALGATLSIHPKQCGAVGVGAVDGGSGGPLVAFPDPMRSGTRFEFDAADAISVEVGVFDASGRLVRTLKSSNGKPGRRALHWDGRNERGTPASPGVYFATLRIDGNVTAVRRLTIVR